MTNGKPIFDTEDLEKDFNDEWKRNKDDRKISMSYLKYLDEQIKERQRLKKEVEEVIDGWIMLQDVDGRKIKFEFTDSDIVELKKRLLGKMRISKFAHSIKNPEIIHYIRNKKYICNGACSTTPSKSTRDVKKVNCKRCLRGLSDTK